MTAKGATPRRGPRTTGEDTRELILAAARTAFAERGYAATSLRSIARDAGVDPALVHHYFDGKAELFLESVATEVDLAATLASVVQGPVETLGPRLVLGFLSVWDKPANTERMVALLRAVVGSPDLGHAVQGLLAGQILGRIVAVVPLDDRERRGALVAGQMIGLAAVRYVVRLPGVADADADTLSRAIGPTLQRYLTEPLP